MKELKETAIFLLTVATMLALVFAGALTLGTLLSVIVKAFRVGWGLFN